MRYPLILRAFQIQQKVEAFVLAAAILLMALLTIVNVLLRSVFGVSLAFAEELTQFLMIVVCFSGLSFAAGQARHIRMSAIFDQLPPTWRRRLMIGISGTTCLLLAVLGGYACRYVLTVYELGAIYPALRIPYYVVYLVVPLGFFSAAVQYALTTWRNVVEDHAYLSYAIPDHAPLEATASNRGPAGAGEEKSDAKQALHEGDGTSAANKDAEW